LTVLFRLRCIISSSLLLQGNKTLWKKWLYENIVDESKINCSEGQWWSQYWCYVGLCINEGLLLWYHGCYLQNLKMINKTSHFAIVGENISTLQSLKLSIMLIKCKLIQKLVKSHYNFVASILKCNYWKIKIFKSWMTPVQNSWMG